MQKVIQTYNESIKGKEITVEELTADISEPVYMWILSSNYQEGFNQDILVGGKSNTPPPTPTTTSLAIKKIDDGGSQITSGVQFGLRIKGKTKYASNEFEYLSKEKDGLYVFENIQPGEYYIYETQNTNDGYNILNQPNYYNGIYSIVDGYLRREETIEIEEGFNNLANPIIFKNHKDPKKINIKIKKIDDGGNQITSGVQFGLRLKGENYASNVFKYLSRESDGLYIFENIEPNTYYIYETSNTNPGYNLEYQAEYYSDYTMENGYVRVGERTWSEADNNKIEIFKNKKTGSITLTKVDKNGNLINGIYFDLLSVDGINLPTHGDFEQYFAKLSPEAYNNKKIATQYTGQSAGNGKVKFENLKLGKYILRETNVTDNSLESYKRNIGSIVNDRWRIYN